MRIDTLWLTGYDFETTMAWDFTGSHLACGGAPEIMQLSVWKIQVVS